MRRFLSMFENQPAGREVEHYRLRLVASLGWRCKPYIFSGSSAVSKHAQVNYFQLGNTGCRKGERDSLQFARGVPSRRVMCLQIVYCMQWSAVSQTDLVTCLTTWLIYASTDWSNIIY